MNVTVEQGTVRIAINGMFWQEPQVGSGQYVHHLVKQYAAGDTKHKFVLIMPRYMQPTKPRLRGIQTVVMPTPWDRTNHNLAKLWFEHIALLQVAHKVRADCLHVPYFGPPRRTKLPLVVSMLDLIPVLLPEYRGNRLVRGYTRLALAGAQRATHIVAISEHVKHDLLTHLGMSSEKITVTHLAASSSYAPQNAAAIAAVRERFKLPHPYIYYIGGFDVRKNVPLLIRAFVRLRQQFNTPLQLVLGGRPAGTDPTLFPDIHRVILDAGVAPDVVLIGRVSEAENAALMSGCAVFAAPSRYEGFGLPPLEAMQAGAPVVASSTTSVGEVVADGGLLVDPRDEQAWADALEQVIRDPQLAAALRQRGFARAQAFDWRTTAAQTLDVYERVSKEHRTQNTEHRTG